VREPLALEGVPRELGFEQGRAAQESLRRACAARGFLPDALERLGQLTQPRARWLRDVRRHFPHQAEWLEGAARGAGIPFAALVRAVRDALAEPLGALIAVAGAEQTLLARVAPSDAEVRRVAPEGRFRSLELARPLLPAPELGVNEAGLAVAASSGTASDARSAAPAARYAAPAARCAAPAALLARDCLERFESVASALAWCLGRPAAPGAALLFADASGEVAGVELEAGGRHVRRPEAGVLVLGVEAVRAARIAKQLGQCAADPRGLAEALAVDPAGCICADARGRRLSLGGAWLALEA